MGNTSAQGTISLINKLLRQFTKLELGNSRQLPAIFRLIILRAELQGLITSERADKYIGPVAYRPKLGAEQQEDVEKPEPEEAFGGMTATDWFKTGGAYDDTADN